MDKNIVAFLTKYNSNVGNIDRLIGLYVACEQAFGLEKGWEPVDKHLGLSFFLLGPSIIVLSSHMHSPSILTQKKKGHCSKCIFQVKKLYFFVTDLARYTSTMIVSNSLRINVSLRWTQVVLFVFQCPFCCITFFLGRFTHKNGVFGTDLQCDKKPADVKTKWTCFLWQKSNIQHVDNRAILWVFPLTFWLHTSNFLIWTTPSQWTTLKQSRY